MRVSSLAAGAYLLMTGMVIVMRSAGGFGESETGSTQPSLAPVCVLQQHGASADSASR